VGYSRRASIRKFTCVAAIIEFVLLLAGQAQASVFVFMIRPFGVAKGHEFKSIQFASCLPVERGPSRDAVAVRISNGADYKEASPPPSPVVDPIAPSWVEICNFADGRQRLTLPEKLGKVELPSVIYGRRLVVIAPSRQCWINSYSDLIIDNVCLGTSNIDNLVSDDNWLAQNRLINTKKANTQSRTVTGNVLLVSDFGLPSGSPQGLRGGAISSPEKHPLDHAKDGQYASEDCQYLRIKRENIRRRVLMAFAGGALGLGLALFLACSICGDGIGSDALYPANSIRAASETAGQ
jgi:hypothetical protein